MKRTLIILSICLAAIGIAAAAPIDDWGCVWTQVNTIPNCIVFLILDWTIGTLLRQFYAGASALILLNPSLAAINPAFRMYMNFLQPFFLLYLVLTAFYLLFMAGSPSGRARAKQMFWKLMLAMILVALSPQLFKIIMAIAHDLSQSILAIGSNSVGLGPGVLNPLVSGPAFILFIMIFPIAVVFFLLSVGLRWLGIMILAALFPITIFFYFFEPPIIGGYTKPLADTLMKSTFTFIFAQTLQALMLAISFIALGSLPLGLNEAAVTMLQMGIAIAGLLMVGVAPLMMMDIMKWIGATVMSAGMALSLAPGGMIAGAALTAAGGVMMGSGPSALWAAGGTLSMGMARKASAAALDGKGGGGGAQRIDNARKKAETGVDRSRKGIDRMSSGLAGIGEDASDLGSAVKGIVRGGNRMDSARRAGASIVRLAADAREAGAGAAQTVGGVKDAGKSAVEMGQGAMETGEEFLTNPIVDRYKAGATLLAQQRQQQQNQGGP